MKLKHILFSLAAVSLLSACEGEKDLIIYEGDLPIKTSTLYMVGDATPTGWNISAPTPMVQSEDDPLVFIWEGALNAGEMKLCLTPGSWDAPFIRPLHAGDEITKAGVPETAFNMHAGDPDDKWVVTEPAIYNLRFDLRNRNMSVVFVDDLPAPVKEPIETDVLYIVGDASPLNEWNIDNPTQLIKVSDYEFVYEGPLFTGELKACTTTGDWGAQFIRPESPNVKIGRDGVESNSFVYTVSPDNKWVVETPGIYRLLFNLSDWTIAAEYTGDFKPASKLYMIGDATDGGWGWDSATVIEAAPGNDDLFVWEGEMGRGTFKASREKDYGAAFYRPAFDGCKVSSAGVESSEMVFTTDPDDKWEVMEAGRYRFTFDTKAMIFKAECLNSTGSNPTLYMIGDATPGGWSLDNATAIDTDTPDLYRWEGELKVGEFKACLVKDFLADFYRPATSGVTISENGVSSPDMVFTKDPDDKWNVTKAGVYELTFDMRQMTLEAVYKDSAQKAHNKR